MLRGETGILGEIQIEKNPARLWNQNSVPGLLEQEALFCASGRTNRLLRGRGFGRSTAREARPEKIRRVSQSPPYLLFCSITPEVSGQRMMERVAKSITVITGLP